MTSPWVPGFKLHELCRRWRWKEKRQHPQPAGLPEKKGASAKRAAKGDGKLRRGENISQNPSPKTVLEPPPPMIRFPPVCPRHVIFLTGNEHRQGQSHFLRPPQVVLKGTLQSMFFPQNRTIHFAPLCRFPISTSTR